MSIDLRAEYDARVFATDASSRSCAAVVAHMPSDLVHEIWRHRPRRGVGQRYAEATEGGQAIEPAPHEGAALGSPDDGIASTGALRKDAHVADASAEDESDSESTGSSCGRWSADLCSAVGWQPVFRYTARRGEHIVTKEARPICTLYARQAGSA